MASSVLKNSDRHLLKTSMATPAVDKHLQMIPPPSTSEHKTNDICYHMLCILKVILVACIIHYTHVVRCHTSYMNSTCFLASVAPRNQDFS